MKDTICRPACLKSSKITNIPFITILTALLCNILIPVKKTSAAAITIQVTTIPASASPSNIFLCPLTPVGDSLYGNTTSTGFISFPDVAPGTYRLWVSQPGYVHYMDTVVVVASSNAFNVNISARCYPITGFHCDPQTLQAVWNPYSNDTILFYDDFSSEDFTTQGWSVTGANWTINSNYGKPSPSAFMEDYPVTGIYDQDITTHWLWGTGAETMTLSYDWGIQNFAISGDGFFDVDIDNGNGWQTLHHRNRNFLGSIDWEHDEIDISEFRYSMFRVRFRMYGDTTDYFMCWKLDNIKVEAKPVIPQTVGYNVFYNWIQIAYLTDTVYTIQPDLISYGEEFNLCIGMVSDQCNNIYTCDSITSQYLPPPQNVAGTFSNDTAFIYWEHPDDVVPQVTRYNILRGGIVIGEVLPSETSFIDIVPQPNAWCYTVKAIYNLEPLGFPPGSIASSMEAGPVCLNVFFGKDLTWTETWSQKETEINGWEVSTGNNTWHLNGVEGYEAPCIAFEPGNPETQYSSSITSPWLNTTPFECASFELTFWMKMNNPQTYPGNNMLLLEARDGAGWSDLWSEFDYHEIDWTKIHVNLDHCFSKTTRLRFSVQSDWTIYPSSWYIDSIQLLPVMNPPSSLTASLVSDHIAQLTWNPVVCGIQNWIKKSYGSIWIPNNPLPTISQPTGKLYGKVFQFGNFSELAIHSLSFSHSSNGINGSWFYRVHLIEWPTRNPIRVYGPYRTTCNDCVETDIPLGDILIKSYGWAASVGIFIEPISLQQDQAFPVLTLNNSWSGDTATSRLSLPGYDTDSTYTGKTILLQLNCLVPAKDKQEASILTEDSIAYQVFRNGDSLTTTPASITSYTDSLSTPGEYCYTIKTIHQIPGGQQLSPPTNTECVLILGIPKTKATSIDIWPNPASTLVNIRTTGNKIKELRLTDPTGKIIRENHHINNISCTLQLNEIPAGFYFLEVILENGQKSTSSIVKL